MTWRLIRKLILFFPSLVLISLFIFLLSKLSPGSAVDQIFEELQEKNSSLSLSQESLEIQKLKSKYGLDIPPFYLSLYAKSNLNCYCTIPNPEIESRLNQMAYKYGNPKELCRLYQSIQHAEKQANAEDLIRLKAIRSASSPAELKTLVEQISNAEIQASLFSILDHFSSEQFILEKYLPHIQWNGFNNQYHVWISGFFSGNFGRSYYDDKAVGEKIGEALSWTFGLSILSLLFAVIIAIPAGVYAASAEDGPFDRFCSSLFFGLHSMPNFWVATLLIVFFANPNFLGILPSYGLGDLSQTESVWEQFSIRFSHLILPLFCWTYGSLAYLYRHTRKAMIAELNSDYIQTTRSKGLAKREILWKHAFKNASFPLITIAGAVLPQLFSGAFVLEYIFAIPGIGMLSMNALMTRDFPVLFGVLMMISVITLVGIFLADLWYQLVDPRLKNLSHD